MENIQSTYLTINEASKFLNLTSQQVRNLCREQKMEAQKIGKSWIIEKREVQNYYDKNTCGHALDKDYTPRPENPLNFYRPIALSFFSGAMGLDIGLGQAGFNTVLACETDNACRKTIMKNKPNLALISDIRDYSPEEIKKAAGLEPGQEIDLVAGGPPCQAFSTAGKRKGFEDERGNVFLTFIDRVLELRPKFAVIENVRGLLSAPLKHRPHNKRGNAHPGLSMDEMKGGALNHILLLLKNAGYGVSFNLYNAANFGTPQKRERVVIIASRDGRKLPYLIPTHSQNGELGLPKWKTFRDATVDIQKIPHRHLNFPEKRLHYYRMLGPGEYWKHLPVEMQKKALGNAYYSGGGKTGFLRRLSWDDPSPTLVTHPAMPATDLAHPQEDRPLSIEEYKRIQQFPDDWQIEGSLVEQYRQVGNAVPVGLGKAVGELLIRTLKNENIPSYPGFKYSRYIRTDDVEWHQEIERMLKKAS